MRICLIVRIKIFLFKLISQHVVITMTVRRQLLFNVTSVEICALNAIEYCTFIEGQGCTLDRSVRKKRRPFAWIYTRAAEGQNSFGY